jgi:DNA-directed RNA polymerase specialized sigma24 family protein
MDGLSRTQIEYLINEWVLNRRDRAVMHRRLIDGVTYEKIAEEFDMSVGQIKNIVYKYQNILRSKL